MKTQLRRTCFVLAVGAGLVAEALDLRMAAARAARGPRRTSEYVDRFAGAVRLLPPRGTFGYTFDASTLDFTQGSAVNDRADDYLLAARAVAPRYLSIGPGPAYVLGDFADARSALSHAPGPQYELLLDAGNGVVLWRKR